MQKRLVYGVGITDLPTTTTPTYRVWKSMLRRCYASEFLEKYPTYQGCTVDPQWHVFSVFTEWALANGFKQGYELDKDILVPNNKHYSPDTCLFVPTDMNKLLTFNKCTKGEYPVGVRKKKRMKTNPYIAECKFKGRYGYVGYFPTPELAHEAWKQRKRIHILEYKKELETDRLKNAIQKVYDNLEEYIK